MKPRVLLLTFATGLALLATGCSKSDKSPTQPVDPSGTLAQATQLLENLLYAQIQSPTSPTRPSDVDLSTAYAKFQEALVQAPANPTANFGSAVLGTMALAQDAEVNAAFDEWKAYVDAHGVPFRAPGKAAPGKAAPMLGVPLGLASGASSLHLPFDLAPSTVAALASPTRVVADPRIGRVQAILRTRALPRLVQSIARLDVVAADPTVRVVVTPRMQGDESETPLEIDHTDVLALRSACQLLAALCDLAVAYDLDFAAYDSTTLVANLSRGSDWMTLAPTGATELRDAQSRLRLASIGIDSTIVSLLAETDDQSDDIIKIGPDPAERARLDAVHADLAEFRTAIAGRWTSTGDWDSDGSTPNVALTFDLNQYFQQPVGDWKALLPGYTVSTERRAWDRQFQYDWGTEALSVSCPATGYYSGYFYWDRYQTPSGLQTYTYGFGEGWLVSALQARVLEIVQALEGTPGWTGEATVSLNYDGNIAAGTSSITVYRNRSWVTSTSSVVVPVITWDAATFPQWTWPDPSLHGILPDIGSTAEFTSLFGITANQWSRRNVLDWTRADYWIPYAVKRPS